VGPLLRARLDHSLPPNSLLHGSLGRNCLLSIEVVDQCWLRVIALRPRSALRSLCSGDKLVLGTALRHDCRSRPATDQIHILFRDAPIGHVAFFGKPFVGNHQRNGARNLSRRILAPLFGESGQCCSQRLHSVGVPRADGVRLDLRWYLCNSRLGGLPPVSLLHHRDSPRIDRRSCPATRGLGIAGRLVINERPHAIGGPLERSLRSGDEKFRRLGSATAVVSIRRGIGKRSSLHHEQYSRRRGAAVRCAAPLDRNRKDRGEGHISSSTSPTIHSIYTRPLFRVCSRLHKL
jgi:hypothetical protein